MILKLIIMEISPPLIILADELGEPTLFSENIAVSEQLETQQQMQEAEAVNQDQLMAAQQMGI